MSQTPDETTPGLPEAAAPARPRRGRGLVVLASVLALVGLAGASVGTLQLVSASRTRDEARALVSERAKVEAERTELEGRGSQELDEADRLEDASAGMGVVLEILHSSGAVRDSYNDLIYQMNRAVGAFNTLRFSDAEEILDSDVGEAIEDMARAVKDQKGLLPQAAEALSSLREALDQ